MIYRSYTALIASTAENKDYSDFDDVIFSSMAGGTLLANYDARTKKLMPSLLMSELKAAIKPIPQHFA